MTLQQLSSSPARVLISGGLPGARGASVTIAAGSPSPSLGQNGDSYIDSTTGLVWNNESGTWVDSGMSISEQSLSAVEALAASAAAASEVAVTQAASALSQVSYRPALDFRDGRNLAIY